MENTSFQIFSRYNDRRWFLFLGGRCFFIGKTHYVRGGQLNDGKPFFDYEGGPLIAVGDKISSHIPYKIEDQYNKQIAAIKWDEGFNCYELVLES